MSATYDLRRFAAAAPARPASPVVPSVATLTGRIDAKLAELAVRGYRVQRIEMSEREMMSLFREGGEEALRLDPDPAVDCAWYGDHQVRASRNLGVWIFIEGEVAGEVSAHVIC
jgi:hypothetical protein